MDNRVSARHLLAVASGKGGVGKSTIAMNMAVVLAQQGARVGLVDCDVYGPDIPAMIGLTRRAPTRGWTLSRLGGFSSTPIEPVERFGVSIVSTGLLFGEEQPLSWPASLIGVLVNQLLRSAVWPDLDYLVLDMPPGTADVTQTVFQAAPQSQAVIVVTPQEVAHLDARKLVTFLLGAIPLDPGPPGTDPGVPMAVSRPDSAFAAAMHAVATDIRRRVAEAP